MIPAPPPPEPDREYFLDHRRDFRLRPAMSGEPAGHGVLVHRDGRKWSWPIASSAAYEVNANTELIEIMAAAVIESGGLKIVTGLETPAL